MTFIQKVDPKKKEILNVFVGDLKRLTVEGYSPKKDVLFIDTIKQDDGYRTIRVFVPEHTSLEITTTSLIKNIYHAADTVLIKTVQNAIVEEEMKHSPVWKRLVNKLRALRQ